MKLFLALFSLTCLTVQSSPEGCQFCVQGIMKVFNYGATDSGIQESILFLQNAICPFEEDMEGCKTGIATWWGAISKKIYVEKGAEHVCKAIDQTCDFSLAKTWDCQTCLHDVWAFANVMTSEAAAVDLVNDLSGPYFCKSAELALDESQIEECQVYIEEFLPKALQLLFYLPSEEDASATCKLYYGLC